MLVDTHCHLNFEAFQADLEPVLERAQQVGVERFLVPATDLSTSQEAIHLAETYPQVFAAVGVHPTEALTWNDQTLPALRELARHPKVVAVGEIGLDTYWDRTSYEIQQAILARQLDLAAEAGLPVIIHCRNASDLNEGQASDDLIQILAGWQAKLAAEHSAIAGRPGVLHSFSGTVRGAQAAVELGFCIGITGPVTFRKAAVMQQVASDLPAQTLLIETDAPFLTPHPHRGKRNEPANVFFVAEKIAELRKVTIEEVAEVTSLNAERLFHW